MVRRDDPRLGITSLQVALTLILNGVERATAVEVAESFASNYGRVAPSEDADGVEAILTWAEEHRP